MVLTYEYLFLLIILMVLTYEYLFLF